MKPFIIYRDTVQHLLHELLHAEHGSTTLIICSTRKRFLEQLLPVLTAHQPTTALTSSQRPRAEQTSENVQPHPFLDQTLELISKSKAVRLAFCPTINTLRAYLSSLKTHGTARPNAGPSLLILDLIFLHHGTSNFSVQGLMRSLASAVEAAARNYLDLQLCECKDINDLGNPDRGPRLWDAQVPLLSGSVKLRGEDSGWSGRTVSVKCIVGRWFEFEKKDQLEDVEADEADRGDEAGEMLI